MKALRLASTRRAASSCIPGSGTIGGGLSSEEIGDGLLEALRVGSEWVVKRVGQEDGYNADPDIHIPLPGTLEKAQEMPSEFKGPSRQ